eukprot:jgi/Ulvmu1/5054/UM021_0071.1
MDPDVQRELKIRRRLENIFNKKQSEFTEKKKYDDYLEQRETYILNLFMGDEIAETEAKIAEYQRLNGESIARNRAAKAGHQGSANAGATVAAVGMAPAAPAAGPAAAAAYTPSMTPAMAGGNRLPVPCSQFTELPDGTIQMTHAERPSSKAVAAASGWSARDILIKAFQESTAFWL